MSDIENRYKVRLIPIVSLINGKDTTAIRNSQVVFDVTPSFSENRTASYDTQTPTHLPGGIQVYKHTNSRSFDITAHFISRSASDALKNMKYLQRLRGWLLPYFGATDTLTKENSQNRSNAQSNTDTNTQERIKSEGVQLKGAPPDVLYLYAYSNDKIDSRSGKNSFTPVNINRVPVVMTSLNISYPDDVDYIPVFDTDSGNDDSNSVTSQPFPRRMDVSMNFLETHSPREYESFNLNAFKLGNLVNF